MPDSSNPNPLARFGQGNKDADDFFHKVISPGVNDALTRGNVTVATPYSFSGNENQATRNEDLGIEYSKQVAQQNEELSKQNKDAGIYMDSVQGMAGPYGSHTVVERERHENAVLSPSEDSVGGGHNFLYSNPLGLLASHGLNVALRFLGESIMGSAAGITNIPASEYSRTVTASKSAADLLNKAKNGQTVAPEMRDLVLKNAGVSNQVPTGKIDPETQAPETRDMSEDEKNAAFLKLGSTGVHEEASKWQDFWKSISDANKSANKDYGKVIERITGVNPNSLFGRIEGETAKVGGGIVEYGAIALATKGLGVLPAIAADIRANAYDAAMKRLPKGDPRSQATAIAIGDASGAVGTASMLIGGRLIPQKATASFLADAAYKTARAFTTTALMSGGDLAAEQIITGDNAISRLGGSNEAKFRQYVSTFAKSFGTMAAYEFGGGMKEMANDVMLRKAITENGGPTISKRAAQIQIDSLEQQLNAKMEFPIKHAGDNSEGPRVYSPETDPSIHPEVLPQSEPMELTRLERDDIYRQIQKNMRIIELSEAMGAKEFKADKPGEIGTQMQGPASPTEGLTEARRMHYEERKKKNDADIEAALAQAKAERGMPIGSEGNARPMPYSGTTVDESGNIVSPGTSALDLSKQEAKVEPTEVPLIKLYPGTVEMTAGDRKPNPADVTTDHTPSTSHAVANHGVARVLRDVMFGAIVPPGGTASDDIKKTVTSVVNGISAPRGIVYIADRWSKMGVPQEAIDALLATRAEMAKNGINMDKSTLGKDTKPIPEDQAATRSWEFLNEFGKQLAAHVQNMGVDASQRLRGTVELIKEITRAGSKYDNAYRMGMNLPVRESVEEHATTPITQPLEAQNGQAEGNLGHGSTGLPVSTAGEGPVGIEEPKPQEAPGNPIGQAASENATPVPAVGGGANGDRGEPSGLLAENREHSEPADVEESIAKLDPETRAKVEAALAGRGGMFTRSDVEDPHSFIIENTAWGEQDPYSDNAPEPDNGGEHPNGPASVDYPLDSNSPYKRSINLTPGVVYSKEGMAKLHDMGIDPPKGFPVINGVILAAVLDSKFGSDGMVAFLRSMGYDSYTVQDRNGVITYPLNGHALSPPVPIEPKGGNWYTLEQKPKEGTRAFNPFGLQYGWGRLEDGKFGWVETGTGKPHVATIEQKPVAQEARLETPVIEDKAERASAVDDATKFIQKNHVSAEEMLTLAKHLGININSVLNARDLRSVIDQIDSEHGEKTTSREVAQRPERKYTDKELTEKFVNYIKDGGADSLIQHLRDNPTKDVALREKQALAIGELRAASKSPTTGQITRAAKSLSKIIPAFFSMNESEHAELKQRELESGTYDTPEEARTRVGSPLPALSNHFDVTPDPMGSFAPSNDVYQNKEGQYQNRLAAGHESSGTIDRGILHNASEAIDKLFNAIAERGGFTPESMADAGVQQHPRIDHRAAHESIVNSINSTPALLSRVPQEFHILLGDGLPSGYIRSGYAPTMLNYFSGARAQHFVAGDEANPKRMTLGQQIVSQLNAHSGDGLPVSEFVVDHQRMMPILLDENHPMYNATVEVALSAMYGNAGVIISGTPHSWVNIDGKNMLLPTKKLLETAQKPNTAMVASSRSATPEVSFDSLYNRGPHEIAAKIAAYNEAIKKSEADAIEALGKSKIDQLISAQNILEVAKDPAKLLTLDPNSVEFKAAAEILASRGMTARLAKQVDAMRKELGLDAPVSKSDLPIEDMAPGDTGDGSASALIACAVPEDTVRSKYEAIRALESLGDIGGGKIDPKVMEVFKRMDPKVFEDMAIVISSNMDIAGAADMIGGLVRLRDKVGIHQTATGMTHTAVHEVAHILNTYMPIPMLHAMDRWYRNARDVVFSENEHPWLKAALAVMVPSPMDENTMIPLGDSFEQYGTGMTRGIIFSEKTKAELTDAMMTGKPESYRKSVEAKFVQTRSPLGFTTGYKLREGWVPKKLYRHLNLKEFTAETFTDALIKYAMKEASPSVREKSGRVWKEFSRDSIGDKKTPVQKIIGDSKDRTMFHLTNAIFGKNMLRRFIGNIIKNGLEEKPDTTFKILEDRTESPVYQKTLESRGPPAWDLSPADDTGNPRGDAKKNYELLQKAGEMANYLRVRVARHLNARSMSDVSWSAADILNSVMGVENSNAYTMATNLGKHYDAAAKMLEIPKKTVQALKAIAEASPEAKKSIQSEFGRSAIIKAPNGIEYLVDIGPNGKYRNAMPMDVIHAITDFQKSGKFTGPLDGLEAPMQNVTNATWDGLVQSVHDLAEELALDPEHIYPLDEHVPFVQNYFPGQYAGRGKMNPANKWFGAKVQERAIPKGEKDLIASPDNIDANLGMYNMNLDPTDYGVNAGMLFPKKHETLLDAVNAGFFPSHPNAVEASLSGAINALGVKARLDMVTGMLRSGMAVPGHDGSPHTQTWPTMRAAVVGLNDEMFGGSLHDVRVHPDAMTIMRYGFAPDFLARSEIGRRAAMISGILNSFQLAGFNDPVNAAMAYAQYVTAHNEETRKVSLKDVQFEKTKKLLAGTAVVGSAVGGAVAGHAMGVSPGVGATLGVMTMASLAALKKRVLPTAVNTLHAIAMGKRIMSLLGSNEAMNPERLPRETREVIAAIQAINIKLAENPVQISRMSKMVSELQRQNKGGDAMFHAFMNIINKPKQFDELGLRNVGGKLLGKIGVFAIYAPYIMDKYRSESGTVDFTNPKMLNELNRLSDDLDNQVGAVQYRKLHQNPALVSFMKVFMRAYAFRYGTERAKINTAADLVNNTFRAIGQEPYVGSKIQCAWEAFRNAATGNLPVRQEPRPGDIFSWRHGTIALKNQVYTLFALARMEAAASHVLWPEANYQSSSYAMDTYRTLAPQIGKAPALAVRGFLSVLPPKGSTLRGIIEHVANEMAAPQFGPDNPNTGTPQRLIFPGGMYIRNFMYEHPYAASVSPMDQVNAMSKWLTSGEGAHIQLGIDLLRGKDTFNRPLGWSDPVRNLKWFKEYNEFFERKPEDGALINALKAVPRDLAYSISQATSLGGRYLNRLGPESKHSGVLALATTFGARMQPPEASLSPAEQDAYKMAYPTGMFGGGMQSQSSLAMAQRKADARVEMSMDGTTGLLQKMVDDGLITKEQFRIEKAKYISKTGAPVPRIVRFLKRAQNDPEKANWKEIFAEATTNEQDMILSYVESQKTTKSTKERHQALIDWMHKQRSK